MLVMVVESSENCSWLEVGVWAGLGVGMGLNSWEDGLGLYAVLTGPVSRIVVTLSSCIWGWGPKHKARGVRS